MNATTHTKAMLEIIVTDMDANGSLIENRMLELQTGDLVRMQAHAGSAFQITQLGQSTDELLLAELGDDLHVTLGNGATFVLADYVALCAAGQCELVPNAQDIYEVVNDESAEQQTTELELAEDDSATATDGEVAQDTSQAMAAVGADPAITGPVMAEKEADDDDDEGWVLPGLGLLVTAGIAAIVGEDDSSGGAQQPAVPQSTTYNIVVALGPVLDGNTELTGHFFTADGSLLGVTDTYDSATGRFTYVDDTNYRGVVVARLHDAGDGEDYFDEAASAQRDVTHYSLLTLATVSEDESVVELVITPASYIFATKLGVSFADEAPVGAAALTAEEVDATNSDVAEAFGISGGDVAQDIPELAINHEVNAHPADEYGMALALISVLQAQGDHSFEEALAVVSDGVEGDMLSDDVKSLLVHAAPTVDTIIFEAANQLGFEPTSDELLAFIGSDADDGNTGPKNSFLTPDRLNAIESVSGATEDKLDAYEAYIDSNPDAFSDPATAAEVQAVVDAVNTEVAVLEAVLEDSASPDGAANADSMPVTAAQLDAVAENVNPALADDYQKAVAAATNLSNPPTVAEVQSIVDSVNAVDAVNAFPEALDAILEDSASPDGAANADGTPVTAEQLDAVAEGLDPALEAEYRAAVAAATDLSNPPTVEEVQALIDAVNATADETLDAILETRPRSNKPDQKTQTKKASA